MNSLEKTMVLVALAFIVVCMILIQIDLERLQKVVNKPLETKEVVK